MKEVRIALLGIGRIGKIHFRNISQGFHNANIIAVSDLQYDEQAFKKEFSSGSNRDIFFTRNAQEAMAYPGVDAVLICTPTSSHADLLEKAAHLGKHIFCEKPMDLSLERSAALADLVKRKNVKLMLGFNRRFDPDFMQAREHIKEGRIGVIQIVKITSRDPGLPSIEYLKNSGGLFVDMAIHDFDMARYMMNKEVVEVFSKGLVLVDDAVAKVNDIDTALTTLTFEDGTYAVIDNSRKAVYGYDQRLEIFGSGGMIQVENNLHNRNIIYDEKGIHKALPLDFFMDRYAASYYKEMELFINALINGTPMPVGGDDGLEATRIAIAARMSVDEGRPVKLSEITSGVKEMMT
jgi:myo-inositol 2-dehydrogenase / D-chiro-inositol 1-dehydrogenase